MEFDFESEQEKTALTGADEAIYQYLGILFQTDLTLEGTLPARICGGNLQLTESSEMFFDIRPERLPFTSHDLQDFIQYGLTYSGECFNVLWNGDQDQDKDLIYGDFYRSVISFRTIEFMVRPLQRLDADDPPRLLIGPGDVQDCLTLALNQNPNHPRTVVVGRGFATNPQDVRDQRIHPNIQPQRMQIPFEWRIDRADEKRTARGVQRWRHDTCRGKDNYELRLRQYSKFCNDLEIWNTREFLFNSEEERLALEGTDELIHPYLMTYSESRFIKNKTWPARLRQDEIVVARSHYNQQPAMPPLTPDRLSDSHDDLTTFQGFWSILWFSEVQYKADIVYDDDFRSVITFGKTDIELMVRPIKHDPTTTRLFICPGDVQDILRKAQQKVEETASRTPAQQTAAVIGQGTVMNPHDNPLHMPALIHPPITFEWKIARASNLAGRIQSWRYKVCGGSQNYHKREHGYLGFLQSRGLGDPREGQRSSAILEIRKRKKEEVATSQGGGPSYKRRSTGSSQRSSAPQSSMGSPEISRPPSVAVPGQSNMDPPPPVGPGEPAMNIEHPMRGARRRRGSRGSRGSIGSATSRVSSRMASLTFQSSTGGSPEGVGSPYAGSLWGGPQGVARTAPGRFGGGYEEQALPHGQQGQGFVPHVPGHGYQGPGEVQQTPAYGQPTNVFGHMRTDFHPPPQRPFQVGIALTQQSAAHGGWNLQHPGQPQAPVGPAPEQHSYQRGYAGPADAPSGRGYSGGSGYNMPASGSHPPGFPPTPPAIHGGRFALPQQPQHRAGVPPEAGDDPSVMQDMPLTESPQFHVPAGTQPFYQHQDMPPLPPPAMSNIDLAPFQAQPTLPPVEQNYPSSLPLATSSMSAEVIHAPEHEDVLADSEPESESEGDDVPEDSESESEGEDDQLSHQDTRVAQPLLPTSGQGDPGAYESHPAVAQNPSFYRDVFMGAGASDDDASDEDNFHRR